MPGSPGEPGPPGEVGSAGPQGEGNTGSQGLKGEKGDVGPQGPQGSKGATGPQGPSGPKGEQGSQGAPGASGQQGVLGQTGAQGMPGFPGEPGVPGMPGSTGIPDVVMISGKLRWDQLPSPISFNPITICQNVESEYGLGDGEIGGNGIPYTSNESWVGINGAAICTATLTAPGQFVGIYGTLYSRQLARIGLGLVVEVNLNRLPVNSLDNCSFTVAGEVAPPSIVPSVIHVQATGISGSSGFISIAQVDENGETVVPQPWFDSNHYIIQGICAK